MRPYDKPPVEPEKERPPIIPPDFGREWIRKIILKIPDGCPLIGKAKYKKGWQNRL